MLIGTIFRINIDKEPNRNNRITQECFELFSYYLPKRVIAKSTRCLTLMKHTKQCAYILDVYKQDISIPKQA